LLPGSTKKVWWKRPKDNDHKWDAVLASRAKGIGYPYCSNKKVCKENCLKTVSPKLAKEYNEERNELSSEQIIAKSGKRVWWQCKANEKHEWETSPNKRMQGTGCPYCAGKRKIKKR